jgi:glycine cleavage system H protein
MADVGPAVPPPHIGRGKHPRRTGPGPAVPGGQAWLTQVGGYPLAPDLLYQAETHMWVLLTGAARARIGMDSLAIETSGTLAELSLPPVGAELVAGRPFGQLEAAKFVGPLVSPVSGTVLAINGAVAADPGLAEREPYGGGWLVEAELSIPAEELPGLVHGADEITRWFAAAVEDYQRAGVIAQ